MKKFHLTQNELCEYGLACEMLRLIIDARENLYTDAYPEELWDINDELLEVLEKASSEYSTYIRNVDKISSLPEQSDSDDLNVSPF